MNHTRPATSATRALTLAGVVMVLGPHVRRVATKAAQMRTGQATIVDVITLAVNPTTNCRHCGQQLTDIVTAITNLGYGPTCVTHVNV